MPDCTECLAAAVHMMWLLVVINLRDTGEALPVECLQCHGFERSPAAAGMVGTSIHAPAVK